MKPLKLEELSSSRLLVIAVLLIVVLILTVSLMPVGVEHIRTSEVRVSLIPEIFATTHFEVYLDGNPAVFGFVSIEPAGIWSGYANLTKGKHSLNLHILNSTQIFGGNTVPGDTLWLLHDFWVDPPHTLHQMYILNANGLKILETLD